MSGQDISGERSSQPGIDGSGTPRARCVLAPNASPMTLDGTNTWIIAEPGSTSVVVIDPGPDDHEDHLQRVLAQARAGDRRVAQNVAGELFEVGNWYARFFHNLLAWTGRLRP